MLRNVFTLLFIIFVGKMSKKVKAEPSPEELFESIMDQQRDQSFREECTDQNTVLKNMLDTLSVLSIRIENGIRMISELHVKVDTIGQKVNQIESYLSSRESGSSRGPSTTPSLKRTFKKVKSLKELETLEQKCHDPEFLQESIDYLGSIHGKSRYMGEGATVCLQLYDTFFDRRFMLSCSWTGSGKKQKKIPFLRFEKVIELYFLAVSYERFLHRCLRNATQRVKEVSGKKPVSRKRKLRAVKENGDGDSEENKLETFMMTTRRKAMTNWMIVKNNRRNVSSRNHRKPTSSRISSTTTASKNQWKKKP